MAPATATTSNQDGRKSIDDSEAGTVTVHGRAAGYAQEIAVGRHRLVGDEPLSAGGTDTGPNPYDFLLAALGSCTSMTVALFARRKGWPLEAVTVRLRHSTIDAVDCRECDTKEGPIDEIQRDVELVGALSDDQRARLLEIADRCPVHRTLTSELRIRSRLTRGGGYPFSRESGGQALRD